jgi:hypothetical protein
MEYESQTTRLVDQIRNKINQRRNLSPQSTSANIFFYLVLTPGILVIVVRLLLLVLALASLRELDAGVYDTPHWMDYLPFS